MKQFLRSKPFNLPIIAQPYVLSTSANWVIGETGSGKTTLCNILLNTEARNMWAEIYSKNNLSNANVILGYNKSTFNIPDSLSTYTHREIACTLIFWALFNTEFPNNCDTWHDRCEYVHSNFSAFNKLLLDEHNSLVAASKTTWLLFDDIDNKCFVEAFKAILDDLKPLYTFVFKIFVRPEMFETDNAPYITRNGVHLHWKKVQLYTLLWYILAQDDEFRAFCLEYFGSQYEWKQVRGLWIPPMDFRINEDLQFKLFNKLTTMFIGDNSKSGDSYSWLPNHLSDGKERVLPETFLDAVFHGDKSLKVSTIAAYKNQIARLNSQYNWLSDTMSEFKGLTLPLSESEILDKSRVQELINLGIFYPMPSGRLDMPEVYRVGYGLGRKGGVKRS